MLAQDNTILDQAASSISQLTNDKKIRDEIWRREDNARIELTNRLAYESIKKQLEETSAQLESKEAQLSLKNSQLEIKDAEIERLQKILKDHNISIN